MNTTARDQALKLALWLTLMEGWASLATAASKLHLEVEQVQSRADWLQIRGFVEVSESMPRSYRWAAGAQFEALWAQLIPERECPMRFRTTPRRTRKLRLTQ